MNTKILIEPGKDGYIVALVPALNSCWSQVKTREEALKNIRQAIELHRLTKSTEDEPTKRLRKAVE